MFQLNGQPISIDGPYTAPDGTRYHSLRDPAVRDALGVIEVADPEPYDQRFYWAPGVPKLLNDREESDEDGNPMFVKVYDPDTEAMVDTDVRLVTKGLKSQWIAQVKDTAGKMLAQTDWMVIRKAERDVAIPESVASARAAALAESDRLESAIAECENVEELIAIVSNQKWPESPD
jgi:hypothetical protein